ncbi:MAG: hypothetical protein E7496_06565 [Ruminococcus sp.]|nr:hypothetical protein [Ruminococcus sp.]
MNMKRIVFAAGGILIMLIIIGITLHSMANINEINQKRREKEKGEAQASQIITTVATTSIWDSLRPTETESGIAGEGEPMTNENGEVIQEATQAVNGENEEIMTENALSEETAPVPQTRTEAIVVR